MNIREMHDVMSYIFADCDAQISTEKRRVWLDQFGHLPFEIGMAAARILVGQKIFGRLPRVADFADAVESITATNELTWGEAWDLWVNIARRFGSPRKSEAKAEFRTQSPLGSEALGSLADEYFSSNISDLPTLRAQFRQRYESLILRKRSRDRIPPDLRLACENLKLLPGKKNGTKN